jgi:hypothetical protein
MKFYEGKKIWNFIHVKIVNYFLHKYNLIINVLLTLYLYSTVVEFLS